MRREIRAYLHRLLENKYPLYVATIMMLLFMCNQMSRYVLVATNVQMANEIHFGERECRLKATPITLDILKPDKCSQNPTLCDDDNTHTECEWYYSGTGYEYQLLAGPIFNIIFSFTGVPIGIILERNKSRRNNVIATCAISWSTMVVLGGLATKYWHIAITRLAIAFFEAAFTAFAVSLISSHFPQDLRSMAMGIFMWGVYFGYSGAFMLKFIANIHGWRMAYFMTGILGIILGLLTYCTVSEPTIENLDRSSTSSTKNSKSEKGVATLSPAPLCNYMYIVILLASAIRCGGGYTFNYNIHNYIHHYYPGYPIEHFLSWIPAVTGVVGSLVGGIWADTVAIHGKQGVVGRLRVVVISLVLSTPLAFSVLLLDPPWCFLVMIPAYFLNEMWGGVIMTTIVEQAPPNQQTAAMAIYAFAINIIGGNVTLLVPTLRALWDWQTTMLILWPGTYAVSVILFWWSMKLAKRRTIKTTEYDGDVIRQNLLDSYT